MSTGQAGAVAGYLFTDGDFSVSEIDIMGNIVGSNQISGIAAVVYAGQDINMSDISVTTDINGGQAGGLFADAYAAENFTLSVANITSNVQGSSVGGIASTLRADQNMTINAVSIIGDITAATGSQSGGFFAYAAALNGTLSITDSGIIGNVNTQEAAGIAVSVSAESINVTGGLTLPAGTVVPNLDGDGTVTLGEELTNVIRYGSVTATGTAWSFPPAAGLFSFLDAESGTNISDTNFFGDVTGTGSASAVIRVSNGDVALENVQIESNVITPSTTNSTAGVLINGGRLSVTDSSFTGSITNGTGGIFGSVSEVELVRVSQKGNVYNNAFRAGLAGEHSNSVLITDSVFEGNAVNANGQAAGLVADINTPDNICIENIIIGSTAANNPVTNSPCTFGTDSIC